jgi:predicted kinase
MTLIIIQGGSAVGKTTLGMQLARDLGFFMLTKDNFKEMFYDKLGTPPTRAESTVYGSAAMRALYSSAETFLKKGEGIILEADFVKKYADPDMNQLVHETQAHAIQIYMTASPELQLKRYENRVRSGERHPGHPDGIGFKTVKDFADDRDKYSRLNINDTIEVSTNSFDENDYKELLSRVRHMIRSN